MRTENTLLLLSGAVAFIGLGVEAMLISVTPGTFGKMNNGLAYSEANTGHMPQAAVAQQLASRLLGNDHNPGMGVNSKITQVFTAALVETGMSAEELAFELLNWPDSPIAAKRCNLQPLLEQDWTTLKIAREIIAHIEAATIQISQRNAWTRWARERAVVDSVGKLSEIDDGVAKTLSELDSSIAKIGKTLPPAEQLRQKIRLISEAIGKIKSTEIIVDFDASLEHERAAAAAKADELTAGDPRLVDHRPSMKSGLDHGREYEAVQVAKKAKDDLISGITTRMNSLLEDINSILQEQTVPVLKSL
ncbi:MAG: hypothetical protein LBJ96_05030 [Holosporaceae bacterium]|nr:hypothetical protein [Holosporaceae bacterium]